MSVSETLKTARQILEPPHAWIKGSLARDADAKPCPPTSRAAKRFDLAGAVEAAAWRLYGDPSLEGGGQAFHDADMLCLRQLRRHVFPRSIVEFNDDAATGHAHVLAFLDRAIAAAKAEEQAPDAPMPTVQAQ